MRGDWESRLQWRRWGIKTAMEEMGNQDCSGGDGNQDCNGGDGESRL